MPLIDHSLPLSGVRVLDLSRGGGARACADLLATLGAAVQQARLTPDVAWPAYDLAVVDFSPAEAAEIGFCPRDLVVVSGCPLISVTPFGLDGPCADEPAGGVILDAVSQGLMAQLAGAHAAAAGLAALRWTRQHGRAVCVEVAAVEVAAACLGDLLADAVCARGRPALGTARTEAPERIAVLRCADGYVGISATTLVDRQDLAALTGVTAVADPAVGLMPALTSWLRQRTRALVVEECQAWRVSAVPALRPPELLLDAQNLHRTVWQRQRDGRVVARSPFRYRQSPIGGEAAASAVPGDLPLSDVRVLDLGMVWAGPYCTRLLAGLGARVIKIESPTRVDGTRRVGRGGCQGVFADLNRGKSSLSLDLAREKGREVFLRLTSRSDVVVENFSPRVMPNLGLAYADLVKVNPALLMASLPAFGASGPWANYTAYGSGLELATALAAEPANGPPMVAPLPYLDYLCGSYAAVGVLAALLARDRTHRGGHLELAQREVASQLAQPDSDPSRLRFEPRAAGVAGDQHLAARGLLARSPAGRRGCVHLARPPFRLHGVPRPRERPAPVLGAQSRRILTRVGGFTAEQVQQLIDNGVVGGTSEHVKSRR